MKRRLRDIAHKEMSKAVHKIDMKENARARATLKEISTLERRMGWFQHGVEKDLLSNLWWWVACLECKGEVQKVSSRLYEEAWEDMPTNGTLVHGRRKDEEAMITATILGILGKRVRVGSTVEKRRRACCIGLAVQAGVHNPHGSGHKSDNCRLQMYAAFKDFQRLC